MSQFPAEELDLELLDTHLHKPTRCCGGGTFQVPGNMGLQQSAMYVWKRNANQTAVVQRVYQQKSEVDLFQHNSQQRFWQRNH